MQRESLQFYFKMKQIELRPKLINQIEIYSLLACNKWLIFQFALRFHQPAIYGDKQKTVAYFQACGQNTQARSSQSSNENMQS